MITHPDEDLLESYALHTLEEEKASPVEEHLLECASCRERLVGLEEFITAFRSVAGELPKTPAKVLPFRVPRPVTWIPLSLAAALMLGIFSYWSPGTHSMDPAVLMLQPLRGVEAGTLGRAGQPLVLTMEVPAESAAPYEVEVVDIGGDHLFSQSPQTTDGKLTIHSPGLEAGNYWVRLYQVRPPSRELLHEFRLQLRDQ